MGFGMAIKIRVCHSAKTVDLAGTSRVAATMVRHLNQDPRFEAYLIYQENADNNRLEECKKLIGEEFLIPYKWEHQSGARPPYYPKSTNLKEVIASIDPSIVHVHRSGYPEAFAHREFAPNAKIVETNIFGGVDHSGNIDLHIYISNFIAVRAKMLGGRPGPILMNPTEPPICIDKEFARRYIRETFNLPPQALLLGRVGRADNFCDISLKAFKIIIDAHPDVYYLVVNPCENWRKVANRLKLNRVIFLPPIINDEQLSMFYAGIDILAHARSDGECQSMTLNEAMYHGVPIVTHVADTYQGHVDQINDSRAGLVAGHRNDKEYADHLLTLINNEELRLSMGENGRQWAAKNVDVKVITKKLIDIYDEILA
jgi:glycosyltransferase involved in cell wall biosynthesis